MATDLGKKPVKSAGAKHDAFVQAQLARAEKRVRWLDVGAALFGFAVLFCLFIVTAAVCDRAWLLPDWARQLSLAGFLLGGGVYLYFTVARPLLSRVNPYYAAQHVERTMPGAKNSVITWLDFQQEKLSPAIHAAVGQKAAKDLSKADIDHAFSSSRLVGTGAAAAVCLVGLIACFIWLGGNASYHLQRIFTPFSFGAAARTTLTITRPANGDEVVTIKRPVTITAHVDGRLPDPKGANTVKLLYRYQENEPYLDRLMRQEGNDFTVAVAAEDVRDGFFYKVVAGELETPEYRIRVRSTPLLTSVQATYRFRPYVARDDEEHYGRRTFKMEAWRGTEITLFVYTNRPVKEAYLVLEGKDGREAFPAEKVEDNPNAFKVKHLVDKTTRYRLEYTTPDGEGYADPSFQDLVAVPDLPPQPVEITAPGRDTQLPCNGVLQVEGTATDDIGVQKMSLRMQVINGAELRGKPYRTDKELRLKSGGYPLTLAYKDYVDLTTVQRLDGKFLALQPDMELEYWLEAADACDYPKPNVRESKHYRVKLLPPEADKEKLKDQKNQAKQEQQQHETKQNDALNKEDQKRQEDEKQRKEDAQREKEGTSGKKPPEGGPKEPRNEGPKSDQPQSGPENPEREKKDKEAQNNAEQLKKALDEKRKGENKEQHGAAKPDQGPEPAKPSESKELGTKPEQKNAPAEPKQEGKTDPMQPPSAPKDPPKQDAKKDTAQKKEEGKNNDKICDKGDCKNAGESPESKSTTPMEKPSAAANKSEGKNAGPENPGNDPKAQPKDGGDPMSAESKPTPTNPDGKDAAKAEPKEDKTSGKGGDSKKADAQAAKPEDVSKLANDIKNKDGQGRKDAAQELDKIAQEAKDPKVRDQAKKVLEEKKIKQPAASDAKQPPPKDKNGGGDSEEKVCATKGDKGMKPGETGAAKDGEAKQQQVPPATQKGSGLPKTGENVPQPPDVAKSKERPPFVPDENLLSHQDEPTPPPGKPVDNKATLLQLRKIQEAIDKKTLDKAGLTQQQYEEFLKNYADLARRQDPAAPADPQNTGKLSGIGGARVNPGATTNPNDPRSSDKVKPPPGYGDAWIQFTRERSASGDQK